MNQLKVCVIAGALSRCKTLNEFLCRLSRIVTARTRTTVRISGTLRAAWNRWGKYSILDTKDMWNSQINSLFSQGNQGIQVEHQRQLGGTPDKAPMHLGHVNLLELLKPNMQESCLSFLTCPTFASCHYCPSCTSIPSLPNFPDFPSIQAFQIGLTVTKVPLNS